jgi:hypothetical protein
MIDAMERASRLLSSHGGTSTAAQIAPRSTKTSTASLSNHCLEATLNLIGQGVVDAV